MQVGTYQYQWADDAAAGDDEDDGDDGDIGRGAMPFQPEFSLKLTENDEIAAVFGFAAGNGLNVVTGDTSRRSMLMPGIPPTGLRDIIVGLKFQGV